AILTQSGLFSPSSPAATSNTPSQVSSAPPTSASPTPSPTATSATPTPTETGPETVNLIPEAYKGQQYDKVRADLIALGMSVNGVPVYDPSTPGTVIDINPSGPQPKGTTIAVSYSK